MQEPFPELGLRVGSLFSGIGGFDRGFELAGGRVMWQCEIDPSARAVLDHHWPQVTCHPDVKEVHGLSTIDVLCGGTPCQDWSVAGKRAGLAGDRTGLFFEFVRVADELAPRWLLFENVPGLLSACSCPRCKPPSEAPEDGEPTWVRPAHRGRDFAVVLAELSGFHPDVPIGGWRNSGVCIGSKRSIAWRVLDAQYLGVPQRRRRVFIVGCVGDPGGAAQVLFEPDSCDGHPPPSREARPGSTPDATNGAGTGGLVAATLQGGGRRGQRIDAEGAAGGHLIPVEVEAVSPAVTSKWAKQSGGPAGDECQNLVAYSIYPEGGQGADLTAIETDLGTSLTAGYSRTTDRGIFVAFAENQRGELLESDISAQLSGQGGKPGQGYAAVREGMMVRRLTPTECCRLMGLPDDWLDGCGLADSVRYRLLGNSVVVPVIRWIAERLVKQRFAGIFPEMVAVSSHLTD